MKNFGKKLLSIGTGSAFAAGMLVAVGVGTTTAVAAPAEYSQDCAATEVSGNFTPTPFKSTSSNPADVKGSMSFTYTPYLSHDPKNPVESVNNFGVTHQIGRMKLKFLANEDAKAGDKVTLELKSPPYAYIRSVKSLEAKNNQGEVVGTVNFSDSRYVTLTWSDFVDTHRDEVANIDFEVGYRYSRGLIPDGKTKTFTWSFAPTCSSVQNKTGKLTASVKDDGGSVPRVNIGGYGSFENGDKGWMQIVDQDSRVGDKNAVWERTFKLNSPGQKINCQELTNPDINNGIGIGWYSRSNKNVLGDSHRLFYPNQIANSPNAPAKARTVTYTCTNNQVTVRYRSGDPNDALYMFITSSWDGVTPKEKMNKCKYANNGKTYPCVNYTTTVKKNGKQLGSYTNNALFIPDAAAGGGGNLDPQGEIGDYVWNDANHNGLQDPDEKGIKGVAMCLKGPNNVAQKVSTDSNGHYLFTKLFPGDYTVQPCNNVLKGYETTLQNVGAKGKNSVFAPNIYGAVKVPAVKVSLTKEHLKDHDVDLGLYSPTPKIEVTKTANGYKNGDRIPVGTVIDWTYVVKNVGDDPIQNLVSVDSRLGQVKCDATSIPVGGSVLCHGSGPLK